MQLYNSWSDSTIESVCEKGTPIEGQRPEIARKDRYGSTMHRSDYGNRHSNFGWEIDHIKPRAEGGTDDLSNLQPLQWVNNVKKSDN